ncbi:MAG: hypothetical protein KatS3mg126_1226 [Lysobacteraceae bacterium]|nr:MAG: hypothetical protein KatS3mg126_1226 [Xanthomonadaceae bacterium]
MAELHLTLAAAEGALVRLLGTIERRGFRIDAVEATSDPRGLRVRVRLADGGRPVEVLIRQLQRLADVREARIAVDRPAFVLPRQPDPLPELSRIAQGRRRGLSFLGIPERLSGTGVGA